MPRVVFSGNRLEQWQLYLAFGGISWAIWGSQSSNRRAASPEKSWLVPALLLLTYLKSCQESLCCSSWLLDKTRECCGEQPHRLSMLIHFSRKQNISGSQMQIYSLESCGTIRKKRKKKHLYFNWIHCNFYIWISDHREMSMAGAGCDNDAELVELTWPYT